MVLADASILFSRTLRDYFLYAADEGIIEIHWSQQILDEMSRNLQKRLGLMKAATDRLEILMNEFLEHALIDTNTEDVALVSQVPMNKDDRHVLAAALSVEADIVLTDNTRHFPRDWMTAHGIQLMTSRKLLVDLAEHYPDSVRDVHDKVMLYSRNSEEEVLNTLESIIGSTAVEMIRSVIASA